MSAQKFKNKNIFIDEDHSHKKLSETYVGKKGYSLFKLRDMDVPIPRFFIVSGRVFSQYINENVGTNLTKKITSEKIQNLIKKGEFSDSLAREIKIGYSRISGFSNTWVAIRASVILPESHQKLSFSGQLETILNSKGIEEIYESIKSVYASAFTSEVTTYLLSNGLTLSDIKVAVVIQKMVQAEVSGVAFTIDPITQNKDHMTIEAVFGLGEVIADGDITPDQYIVNKENLNFEEKRILPQKWMTIRKIRHKPGEDGEQKVNISPLWQNRQKLENRYLEELVKVGMQIEKTQKAPQDIEWVFEGGHIWILQTKKAKSLRIKELDIDIRQDTDKIIRESVEQINIIEESKKKFKEEMEKKKLDLAKPKQDIEEIKVPKKRSLREVIEKKVLEREVKIVKPGKDEKLLITGVGASKGSFRGKVKIINSSKDLEGGISDSSVLVLKKTYPEIEGKSTLAGAIVSNIGGLTSDLAIICREKKIPCVIGTHIATKVLNENEEVLVDGEIGAVYGKRKTGAMPQNINLTPSIEDLSKYLPEEEKKPARGGSASGGKKTKKNTATKVFLDLSYGIKSVERSKDLIELSDGLSHIRLEDIYRSIGRHPGAYIEEGRAKEFIKQASEEIAEICQFTNGDPIIIGIGSMSVEQYKELTKGASIEKYDDTDITDSTNGLQRLLKNPKELNLAIKIIKRVRNVHGYRNVSIAIEYAGSPQNIIEFKKSVSAAGLRRSSTFKIFLMVDTPSIALIVDQYEATGIDGMIIDIKSLKDYFKSIKYHPYLKR